MTWFDCIKRPKAVPVLMSGRPAAKIGCRLSTSVGMGMTSASSILVRYFWDALIAFLTESKMPIGSPYGLYNLCLERPEKISKP